MSRRPLPKPRPEPMPEWEPNVSSLLSSNFHVQYMHVHAYSSYMTLIGMHELHGRMHPN